MKKLLLFVAAVLTSATMNAQETWEEAPVSSGFNFDGICESAAAAPTQRGPLDTHGSQLVTQSTGAMQALPDDGYLLLDNEHPYQFASFDGYNTLVLTKSTDYPADFEATEGVLQLQTNVNASKLGFLFITTNKENNNVEFDVTPIYTDGEGDAQSFSISRDWGQGPTNEVFKCNRWRVTAGSNPETGFAGSISEEVIELDATRTLRSVKFTYKSSAADAWGWHYVAVFGLSVAKSTTGINDITAESEAAVKGIYTVDGRQVSEAQHGVNIVKMSNGKAKKVIRK